MTLDSIPSFFHQPGRGIGIDVFSFVALSSSVAVGAWVLARIHRSPTRVHEHEKEGRKEEKEKEWEMYKDSVLKQKDSVICRFSPQAFDAVLGYPVSDVTRNAALSSFSTVQRQTKCLFARHAKLWGCPAWNKDWSLVDNIISFLPSFTLFTSLAYGPDGYVMSLPIDDEKGGSIADLRTQLNIVLHTLGQCDPSGYNCMRKSYLGKRGWVFEFNRQELFITTFAPGYTKDNSRYAYGVEDHIFILFQPYYSFLAHHVGKDVGPQHTDWENPVTIRDKIRVNFAKAGQKYFIPSEPQTYPIAAQYVAGQTPESATQVWWTRSVPDIVTDTVTKWKQERGK